MKTGAQIFLWILCLFFSYKIYDSINGPINFNKVKENRYSQVIDRMKTIRKAQIAHRDVKGFYANNFDSLIKFVDDGIFTLIEKNHVCGSDRVAEASINLDADIIVNVQADEPFIDKKSLSDLIKIYKDDKKELIDMVSLMSPMKKSDMINNPNIVKVIVDNKNFALYFSRAKIPFDRDQDHKVNYFRHIGVYGFRRKSLIEFSNNGETSLEKSEKIECIRQLEMGKKIKMVKTNISSLSIDEFSDLLKAEKRLN